MDTAYLRQHYATLSDEALQEIERGELVDAARRCYDDELRSRGLVSDASRSRLEVRATGAQKTSGEEEKPDWLDEGAEVYSSTVLPGASTGAQEAADAADALRSAGIPCYLEMCELPREEESAFAAATHRWRLVVPGKLNLRATSVLDEEIFNPELEAQWRAHLEALPDSELEQMNPQVVYSGLYDRIERITKVYDEEVLRRGLMPR